MRIMSAPFPSTWLPLETPLYVDVLQWDDRAWVAASAVVVPCSGPSTEWVQNYGNKVIREHEAKRREAVMRRTDPLPAMPGRGTAPEQTEANDAAGE